MKLAVNFTHNIWDGRGCLPSASISRPCCGSPPHRCCIHLYLVSPPHFDVKITILSRYLDPPTWVRSDSYRKIAILHSLGATFGATCEPTTEGNNKLIIISGCVLRFSGSHTKRKEIRLFQNAKIVIVDSGEIHDYCISCSNLAIIEVISKLYQHRKRALIKTCPIFQAYIIPLPTN